MNSEGRKILGVLGGLGPMSSVYFYELVTELTAADKDQDHLDIIISSRASTPDRTDFILGRSEKSPLPVMCEEAGKLVAYGADVLALTCNTAHFFYEELQNSVPVKVLNIGSLAVEYIRELGVKKVGLLATSGTVKCGIYQQACSEKGIECVTPDESGQETVMKIIYEDIKSGKAANMRSFFAVSDGLKARGAELLILGCTELSLLKKQSQLDDSFIDPLRILAERSIISCGHELRK